MIKEEFESLNCVHSRSDMRVEGSSNESPHARSPLLVTNISALNLLSPSRQQETAGRLAE